MSSLSFLVIVLGADIAAPPGVGAAPVAAEATLSQRLASLEAALAKEERHFQIWRWSWTATYAALTVGSLVAVPFVAKEARVDYYTAAVTSAAAVVPTLLFVQPPPPAYLPGAEAPARLRLAEQRLAEVAAYQREARTWKVHVINIAVNAATSAFLGFGFDRWKSAALNFVAGTALGELQILTHPNQARHLLSH